MKKSYEIETNELNLQPEKWKPPAPWPQKLQNSNRAITSDITNINSNINRDLAMRVQ